MMTKKIGFAAFVFALFFLVIYIFQYVWNVTIPQIFGLKEITYLQALGIIGLSRVIFGGYGFRWMNQCRSNQFWMARDKKCANLTSEQKEEICRKIKEEYK